MSKRVLSGMRPTGQLHLGHLVGALENWVQLQKNYECFFMVADWHAFMSEYKDLSGVSACAFDNVIDWLSCGIDPEKSTIFIQSQVKEHLELYMILSCIVPLGWLERCPTYKEQKKELADKEITNYAFLGYPVLQAADIMLYRAGHVPVGEDQLPHLEICREIVRRFHSLYKKEVFVEPQGLLTEASRLLGIDGRKMSKSYHNTIALSDSNEIISKKISRLYTDPKRIHKSDPGHPDKCNVHSYYEVFKPEIANDIAERCRKAQIGCTECKAQLASIIIEKLAPLQEKRRYYEGHRDLVSDILADGKKKAELVAHKTMAQVSEALGYGTL